MAKSKKTPRERFEKFIEIEKKLLNEILQKTNKPSECNELAMAYINVATAITTSYGLDVSRERQALIKMQQDLMEKTGPGKIVDGTKSNTSDEAAELIISDKKDEKNV